VTHWLGTRAGASLTAVLVIAAAGAVWAMVAILARQPVPWLALPMTAAALLASRSIGLGSRWALGFTAGLLAAGGTTYALAIFATDRLARMLGRGFVETAIAAGPEMIAALAWARLDDLGRWIVVASPLLAALWAAGTRVDRTSTRRS
jgi:hypothetical protein